ncbi:MAG: hypothetical protein ABFS86_02525, partial [Planctomycetota bacterium]
METLAPRVRTGPSSGVVHLLIGVPIALVIGLAGPISFVGWFLTALVHEMGHCAAALFFGSFAVPAIRLDGHAAAVHSDPSLIAQIVIWAVLGGLAWRFRGRRALLVTLAVAAALYPLFAFTRGREIVHLLAGHLSELAFATLFFWQAMTGRFTKTEAERPFYAALGWLWMGGAIVLFGSLAFSESSREWYLANGSFGLENDLVRVARMFKTSLPAVALPMLLLA